MSKHAIVVVDLQNDYLPTGRLPVVGIEEALEKAAQVIGAARRKGIPVIHVRHECIGPGAAYLLPDTDGARIHPAVAPLPGEKVIVKNYPNSFLKTPLQQVLDEADIEDVTIIGAMSHMCIAATARAASDFGYRTTVVEDACATRDLAFQGQLVPAAQVHAANMAALGAAYATVLSARDWLTA